MTLRPRAAVVELHTVAHQHLRQSVPGAHQIQPQRLAGTHQIPQRFLFAAGHADRVQLAGQKQPDEMLGVTAIVLDLVLDRPLNDQTAPSRASSDNIFCGSSTIPRDISLSMLACISADGGTVRLTA